jgi:hypothetical protein
VGFGVEIEAVTGCVVEEEEDGDVGDAMVACVVVSLSLVCSMRTSLPRVAPRLGNGANWREYQAVKISRCAGYVE